MNEEAVVVNLFLTVRVFLVGGILLVFPRIARKGLVFGTYVGEAVADGDEVRILVRRWGRGVVFVMALSLLVGYGISLAGWPVRGNLTGTAVLLLSAPALYFRMYRKARTLAPPDVARKAQVSAAPFSVDAPRGVGVARFALAVCVLTAVATVVWVAMNYDAMPDRVPTFTNLFGVTDGMRDKSIALAMFAPSLNLVVSTGFALMALWMTGAKRSVRGGSGSRSTEAQNTFRVVVAHLFSGMALFICLLLTIVSVQMIRVALAQAPSLGFAIAWVSAAMVLYALVSLIRIMRCLGQGGALLEEGTAEAPLTGGLADNAHWFWGVFYADKEDPSALVESRFGIGYTLNFGNRNAVLVNVLFLVLLLGLALLVVTGVVS